VRSPSLDSEVYALAREDCLDRRQVTEIIGDNLVDIHENAVARFELCLREILSRADFVEDYNQFVHRLVRHKIGQSADIGSLLSSFKLI
jgi:hypothetical protein